MAQDPWRRAYQMQRLKQAGVETAATGRQPRPQRKAWQLTILLLLLMLALGAAGYFAWLSREQWLPQAGEIREELPAPLRDALPKPRHDIDQAALEQGLGINLAVFASPLDVIRATREWGLEWKLTATGADRTRLSAPGVKIDAQGDMIEFYDLDVPQVFAAPEWRQWLPALRLAGISPEMSWEMLTGEKPAAGNLEYEYRNRETVQWKLGRVRQAYVLRFVNGYLRHVEGQISLGPMREPGPVSHAQPPQNGNSPQPGAEDEAPILPQPE